LTGTTTGQGVVIQGPASGTGKLQVWQADAGTEAGYIGANGALVLTPTVRTGAPLNSILLTAPAHTNLNAATEYSDVYLNLARTAQFQVAAGLTTQRAVRISAPTYSSVGVSTITTAVTMQIDSTPVAGTNLTITNAIALRVLTGTTAGVGVVIQGAASQTGDLFQIQNSTSTTLLSVNSNGSLSLSPYGTSAGQTNEIRFLELAANGTHYVGFKAGDSIASNVIWTLPTVDGTSGQFLSTNGSSVLSWGTPTSKSAGSDIFLANNFGGL
jgi:hypothetical protein